jgi:hypothetical protein
MINYRDIIGQVINTGRENFVVYNGVELQKWLKMK